ncbi:Hypothetical predicted protein [Mytilus galloprovincialis]|uniref:C-type lectin domain-containing protein n=1 Tax=Mytilus galloprovincialis TaxID=29158 RepID=A0A8B6EC54_MYTGA|nr:Hypothetical predicted protein [Mytilus galloprovincialis]
MDNVKRYLNSIGGAPNTHMFIGLLYNKKDDQKFRWLDNEILTWVRWDSGEPNCMQNTNIASFCQSNKENCVRLTDGYKLRTVDCKKFNYYMLCSKAISTTTTSTTLATTRTAKTSTPLETTTHVETTTFSETTTPVKITSLETTTFSETTTPVKTGAQETTTFPETVTSSKTAALLEITTSVERETTEYNFLYLRTEIASSPSKLLTTSTATDTSFSHVKTTLTTTSNQLQCCCLITSTSNKWLFLQDMNLTVSELRTIVEDDFEKNIKKEISVNTNTLSKTIRERTSAPDKRKSSSRLGWVSISIITLPVLLMVLMDIINIFQRNED